METDGTLVHAFIESVTGIINKHLNYSCGDRGVNLQYNFNINRLVLFYKVAAI